MNRDEYLSYISEIKELEALLGELPTDNILERAGLESRLKSAKSAIANVVESRLTDKARLTFRGEPVFGSHGITAEFGSKAAGAFAEVVAAIAAGLSDNLQGKGPIPDKQKKQLLITGTAIGSFGFEFELPDIDTSGLISEQTNVEKALKIVQKLFQSAAEGSDDDIAELIEEIHPRAFKKTAEFLNYVAQHDAWCALDFKNQSFRFQNLQQIENASKRLQENNIRENIENFVGEFQGILPSSRTFEFKVESQGIIIKGNIGKEIENPDLLNREYLHKLVSVDLNITQVGTGKPRFALSSIENIKFVKDYFH